MSKQGRPSEELMSILVCPICRKKVELKGEALECGECGRRYPIRDGIPDMVVDEDRTRESGD